MFETRLNAQLGELRAWRHARLDILRELKGWLDRQGLLRHETREAIERAMRALHDNRLTVAVAGEYSRGKSELLNALFFADLGCRLLPADAGRTTMCPTEILHDDTHPPQLSLLPIDSRCNSRSLASLRNDPSCWEHLPLTLGDNDALTTTLARLTEQQLVARGKAAELGFSVSADPHASEVTIPRWRLARINIPHPLLQQGLRVLDTPGLNAIGNEPELTYEMLPTAHAILFVLGADTGVTDSDLQIWKRHIRRPVRDDNPGLLVVLNKTDTLWDELRSPQQITQSIIGQCRATASTLSVDEERVFAVSAQKALLARTRKNRELERRSGIATLEDMLGGAMMENRVRAIKNEHTHRLSEIITALHDAIKSQIGRGKQQQHQLLDLAKRSGNAIERMLRDTQYELSHYQSQLRTHRRNLIGFQRHAQRLLNTLDTDALNRSLDDTRRAMTGAWTTRGLREAMGEVFEDVNNRLRSATTQAQLMRRVLRSTYRQFEQSHQLDLAPPPMLSIVHHQVELSLLEREAEVFRNSRRTTLTEQHIVTRRYFNTIVARARMIITIAHDEAKQWANSVMQPLTDKLKAHHNDLTQRIEDLRTAGVSRQTVQNRVVELQSDISRQQAQLSVIERLSDMLAERQTPRADKTSAPPQQHRQAVN